MTLLVRPRRCVDSIPTINTKSKLPMVWNISVSVHICLNGMMSKRRQMMRTLLVREQTSFFDIFFFANQQRS